MYGVSVHHSSNMLDFNLRIIWDVARVHGFLLVFLPLTKDIDIGLF